MADETPTYTILRLTESGSGYRTRKIDAHLLAIHPFAHAPGDSLTSVLRMADLEALLGSVPKGLITDRGTQGNKRHLSPYLVGRPGLLALRAIYRNPSQAVRGLRALVHTAAQHKSRAAFLIGVDTAIFDALMSRAMIATSPAGGLDDVSAEISSLVGAVTVPDALRQKFIGEAAQVEWVRRCIVLAAGSPEPKPVPILIQGETGTGKEIVARQIHNLSARKFRPFIPVNCGGIPTEFLESELFGHVKGAFTGATHNKPGLWTAADHGTLFLDEIGDLPPYQQVKLLRALDDGGFRRLGDEEMILSNARVIAATNRDLVTMVQEGHFREDLYYRLFNFRIRTPALREHPRDIPMLARHFWEKVGSAAAPLTDTVAGTLVHYPWPGNARELRAFLANIHVLANGRNVDVKLVNAVMRERLGVSTTARRDS